MNDRRQSQATLPSTEHSFSEQPELETNTSVHNNLVSNEEMQGSNIAQNNDEDIPEPERSKSHTLSEIEKRQNQTQQSQGRKMSKSEGQPSRSFDKKEEPQKPYENQKPNIEQGEWGGQNLLQSQQPFSLEIKNNNPFSQASENLLDFPYTIQDHPQDVDIKMEIQNKMENKAQQEQVSTQIFQKIVEIAEHPEEEINSPQKKQKQSEASHQSRKYEVTVTQTNDQNLDKLIKNNDIYGLENKKHIQESPEIRVEDKSIQTRTESFEPLPQERSNRISSKLSTQERDRRAVLAGYYDAKESQFLDNNLEHKLQTDNIDRQQNQKTEFAFDQSDKIVKRLQDSQELPSKEMSIEQIRQLLKQLVDSQEEDEKRYQIFKNIVSKHIDLLWPQSMDQIGKELMSSGEIASYLIKLLPLRDVVKQRRTSLQRLYVKHFEPYITTEQSYFQDFKNKYYKPLQIHQSHSQKIEVSPLHQNRQSIKSPEKVQEVDETASMQVHPSVNNEPQSIMKSYRKQTILEPQSQFPVKRTRINPRHVSKEINKTEQPKPNPRKKAVKVIDPHLSESDQKPTKKVFKNEETRRKFLREMKKLGVRVNEADTVVFEQDLGSGYTYLELQNRTQQTFIQPVRASHRLFQREESKPSASKSRRKSFQIKKEVRMSVSPNKNESPVRNNSNNKVRHSKKHSVRKTNQKIDQSSQFLNLDYIRKHFREINFDSIKFDGFPYTPLTREDQNITDLISDYKHLEEEEIELKQDYQREVEENTITGEPFEATITSMRILENQEAIAEKKKQLYSKIQQYYQSPIEVQRVVDPNINNHGLYALLELSKKSAFIFKAKYFVTQISNLSYAPRKLIDEDLETIKDLVQEKEKDNIGSMAPNQNILKMIREEEEKREKGVNQSR